MHVYGLIHIFDATDEASKNSVTSENWIRSIFSFLFLTSITRTTGAEYLFVCLCYTYTTHIGDIF